MEKKYELEEIYNCEFGISTYYKIVKYLNKTEKNVIIPSEIDGIKVVEIGERAFYNKKLKNIIIPDTVKEIRKDAFKRNKLENVIIPDSVKEIEKNVFDDNKLIKKKEFDVIEYYKIDKETKKEKKVYIYIIDKNVYSTNIKIISPKEIVGGINATQYKALIDAERDCENHGYYKSLFDAEKNAKITDN